MGLFDFWKKPDINEGVRLFEETKGAVLLDVRSPREYASGHISGSINLPLQDIDNAAQKVVSKAVPLFVYCLSGARSQQAAVRLHELGYVNVRNIGGIGHYDGQLEE